MIHLGAQRRLVVHTFLLTINAGAFIPGSETVFLLERPNLRESHLFLMTRLRCWSMLYSGVSSKGAHKLRKVQARHMNAEVCIGVLAAELLKGTNFSMSAEGSFSFSKQYPPDGRPLIEHTLLSCALVLCVARRLGCPAAIFAGIHSRSNLNILHAVNLFGAQACAFRDSYDTFLKAGAEVIGVSGDSPESHAVRSGDSRTRFMCCQRETACLGLLFCSSSITLAHPK